MSRVTWSALALCVAVVTPPSTFAASSPATSPSPSPVVAQPAVPPVPAGEAPAPESIPVPEVARRAEEASRQLRDVDTLVKPQPFIESIESRLPNIATQIARQTDDTDRQLTAEPSAPILDGLTAQWQTTRAEMGGYVNVLAQRATALEDAMKRLTALQETWTRARAEARASRAPAPVRERIDTVLASIAAARTRLQEQRADTLLTQDRFALEVARCDATLERIARIRQELAGRLLEQDSVPLWRTGELASTVATLPDQIRQAAAADIIRLRQFVQLQRRKIPLQIALFVGLALVIRAARRRMRVSSAPGETATVRALVLDRYISAALLLTLLSSPWLYSPPVPRIFIAVSGLLALVPSLRLMQVLIDRSLLPALYLAAAFFVTDIVRHSASAVPLLERLIFLFEMFAAVAVLAWRLYGRRPPPTAARILTRMPMLRVVAGVVMIAFSAAFVAGILGYMRLALVIGGRILGNGYLALVLYAGLRVADGLVAFALRTRPLRSLGMVEHRRPLLERRAHNLLLWVAIGAWVVLSLQYFGLWAQTVESTRAVLGAELNRGTLRVSLGDMLVFAITVTAAFVLSAVLRFVLKEDVYPRLNLARGLPNALSGLLHYCILLAGFFLGLATLGVDLTKVTILAGAFGVGIGFGLQSVVNNFVSGTLILFERKINVGDAIQIGDVAGQVQQMGMRACTVRTWEGAEVIVPNASFTTDKVTNWTLSDRRRRIDVVVGVAYGTAPEKALDILLSVARAHPRVLAEPTPTALFRGFDDSALRFEMRVWTDRFDAWMEIQSELSVALYLALQEAGIEIPFPQREVRLRMQDAGAKS